jgi:hypothetical protein
LCCGSGPNTAIADECAASGVKAGQAVGVTPVPPPPSGFNPLTAAPSQLANNAIPPAPNKTTNPIDHERWATAVSGAQASINKGLAPLAAPTLTPTNIFHGPNSLAKQLGTLSNGRNATATSNNWSGSAVLDVVNRPFSREAIYGIFTVPEARQAFGVCNGGWNYMSAWPGIDGWGSGDVLQGGVEADAYCSGSTTASYYSAWVEWYPYGEVRVSAPAVSPGDLIFVEVWNTSATTGYVYFYNYSTQQSAQYYLTAPSGSSLAGTSAEWIVERPSVGGSLANLRNYVYNFWSGGLAWNYTSSSQTNYDICNASPSTGTWYMMTMLDNSGNGISSGSCENSHFLHMTDYGSAY